VPFQKILLNKQLRVFHLGILFNLVALIRKHITLKKVDSLYLFVNDNELLKTDSVISDVYDKYKDEDGYQYNLGIYTLHMAKLWLLARIDIYFVKAFDC
jgi:hypothetical protein